MNKTVFLSICIAAMHLCCASASARHITPDSDTISIHRIDSSVVSAYNFYEHSISAFGTVLMNSATLALPVNATAEQGLRLLPSIDIRERGGKSVQTDIGIRGGGSDQTGMLLNGVDFTDIRTGHQTHSLPVDSEILNEIRLLDGGNQGLTGALNMVAGPLYDDYLRLNLSGGDFGYRYANLSGATTYDAKGRLNIFEAASFKKSDGYRPNTDFENYNLYTRVQYQNSKIGTFDAQAGYQNRAFGANGFYSLAFPDQFEQTSTGLASIRWNKAAGRLLLESYISCRHNTDRFELIRGSEARVPFNYHVTDNLGAYLSSAYVWAAGRTSISGEMRHGEILSTVLGTALDEPVQVRGASDRVYTKGKTRNQGNIQLRHQKQWDKFGIKAAIEGDFSPYGFTPLWNAGMDWNPTDSWSFDLIGARTMRLPTFTDLYYTATGYVGNENLMPEKATMAKLGAKYHHHGWNASVDAFFRHGDDLIDWVRESATSDWESRQITEMNTFGVDAALSYTPERGILHNITAMAGYIDSDKSAQGLISKYAMDYMKFKASLIADFRVGKHWALSANASYYDREGNYADASGATLEYAPYAILNANLSYTAGAFKIYVDCDNLTSTKYFDFGGLEMPGCWAMAGVVITIK